MFNYPNSLPAICYYILHFSFNHLTRARLCVPACDYFFHQFASCPNLSAHCGSVPRKIIIRQLYNLFTACFGGVFWCQGFADRQTYSYFYYLRTNIGPIPNMSNFFYFMTNIRPIANKLFSFSKQIFGRNLQ